MDNVEDIQLGDHVKDVVSGFEGIATGRCTYLNGCHQILITPKVTDEGKKREGDWIDLQQIELVESDPLGFREASDGEYPRAVSRPGGPRTDAPTGLPHP